MNRREAIFSLTTVVTSLAVAPKLRAREMHNVPLETSQNADHLPQPLWQQGYRVLTNETDRQNLTAIFDRLIPADQHGPSASAAGCIEFIDGELAGEYGAGAALYLDGPMQRENEEQLMGSPQFLATPKERYMTGLKALEAWAQVHHQASFHRLTADQIDNFLHAMEAGEINLSEQVNSQAFFELMLQNAREGYLSDPIYGGNKNMAGWKMIGFPGARYDYRPYIDRRNEDLALIPVSLIPDN
ncbi:gluconate 2-dehydrogenase subunit 3 family protein [Erwiniaceae bacterium BAC15a-03b]|uniref:Gluconate 2-dehydrogenase subunit 3 family protein n=1 Tax=Winslowiella arboricola TaxID=2978220 RepID=A0A9J6PMQ9_9GAMM|nr:gluconate 2-dehydrogenase subunit 3 family protein [Winslowiella arboricola]MCU5774528.1 gluconate 2-dehydrogenase subunit 3 family protein [Winslowiella arboricola]MCU5778062.1 gluconate 2-dehydrogenase subunit 3 family protein [Winslowiella arboricola]